jgi:cysteine desulfurase / selenocysteine lyase
MSSGNGPAYTPEIVTRKLHEERSQSKLDIGGIRRHFLFPSNGRIVTNNAASTQMPIDLIRLQVLLAEDYENVHRGQSRASKKTTADFESSYDTMASLLNAPDGRKNILFYRNASEGINSVMYMLMTEFRQGDNVVTTMMEHNSNYVPWYGMCREILPRLGVKVDYRIVDFDKRTGELDLAHMASLIDNHTKLVCCTGASNFLGTKPPLNQVREMAKRSGYQQPDGRRGSYFLVDGAQLVPGNPIDVQEMDADFLAFSCHKMLAPMGAGVLYARQNILESALPFLYGGDMIAQGEVSPEKVGYNELPWKFCAGTPNIIGTILAAQAVRLLVDFVIDPNRRIYFHSPLELTHEVASRAMKRVNQHLVSLTSRALERMMDIPNIEIYGPKEVYNRTSLVAFNIHGQDPMQVAEELDTYRVEARAGCHCATMAHYYLGLKPPASCRLSFYVYNNADDIDAATEAVRRIALHKPHPARTPISPNVESV